jgi:hypothetical protein
MPRFAESAIRKGRALTRVMRLLPGVVLAIAVAGMGVSAIQGPEEQAIPRPPMAPKASWSADAARADATELQPVQSSDGGASGPGGGVAVSATPAGGQEFPSGPPVQGRASETSAGRGSATAGPPVSYTDPADDAYGLAAQPTLSQPAFDILEVR